VIRVGVRSAEERDLASVTCRRGRRTAERFEGNTILGSSCVIAEHASTVVGYVWINTMVFEFLGERLRNLPSGAMCIHDVFVFPEYRGQRALQQLLAEVFESSRAAGLDAAVCVVDRENAPAVAAFRRAGVRFRRAPILKLPGVTPMLLGVRSMGGARP
jgi:ribosomal protein S18 acetylase RimI-like enzyme